MGTVAIQSDRGFRLVGTKNASAFVGHQSFRLVGVSDYSRTASSDPADIVTFDLQLDEWLRKGFQGMSVADVSALRKERQESR
jgi:hypothetical protein